ncbi:Fungal specific transcription factor [Paramyrothecium foliicola]|nr:Fungal specific transcription factor [Paramyrothecium foliicola]
MEPTSDIAYREGEDEFLEHVRVLTSRRRFFARRIHDNRPAGCGMQSPSRAAYGGRRARPCDACRRRKRRCVTEPGDTVCQLCRAGAGECTFTDPAVERGLGKRSAPEQPEYPPAKRAAHRSSPSTEVEAHSFSDAAGVIEDYDVLPMPSLLKTNLGLQQHRYIRYIGPSDELDSNLLALRPIDERQEAHFSDGTSCRRVSRNTHFALVPYSRTQVRTQEIQDLDAIEGIVRPHGKSLVNLYFKIIHPCFPILDKKTFMEKYARTHREFSAPCLAGVYMLASKWWHYDRELSSQKKTDVRALERIARASLQSVIHRPKLSTIQGGLLLLQYQWSDDGAWALSAQMVAVAQELGIDTNCAKWTIPAWEKGLRRRLGWAIYMMDKWMALCRGRPSHIVDDDWTPEALSEEDLSDSQDETEDDDTIEGSTDAIFGGVAFEWMISLTHIVSEILKKFYSRKALADTPSSIRTVLEMIKPVQVKLREWHRDLPSSLQLNTTAARRLSSNASLHLSYYAAEIALHRVILSSLLRRPCDPYIVQICRGAAKERVTSAVDLVTSLKPQHLQAFWYFPSGYCLVTIGTFTALLFITSQSMAEAEFYRKTLDDYRWLLRVTSRATEYMDFAVQRLDRSLSHIHELTSEDIAGHSTQPETQEINEEPQPSRLQDQSATQTESSGAELASEDSEEVSLSRQNHDPSSTRGHTLTSLFFEDAILNAIGNESLFLDSATQHDNFLTSCIQTSPTADAVETTPRTLEYDYQQPGL